MLTGSSSSNRGSKDVPSGCRQLMEDVGNIEVQNNSNLKLSEQRFDLEELLMSQLENGRAFKQKKSKLGKESETMVQMNQEECENI